MKNFIFSRDGQFSVYGGVLVAGDIEAYRIGIDMGCDTSDMTAMAVCQENGEYNAEFESVGNRIFVTLASSMYSVQGFINIRFAVSKGDSVITAKEIRFRVAPPNNSETLAQNESGTISDILTAVYDAKTAAQNAVTMFESCALQSNTYTKTEIDKKISSVFNYKGTVEEYSSLPSAPSVGDVYNIRYAFKTKAYAMNISKVRYNSYIDTELMLCHEEYYMYVDRPSDFSVGNSSIMFDGEGIRIGGFSVQAADSDCISEIYEKEADSQGLGKICNYLNFKYIKPGEFGGSVYNTEVGQKYYFTGLPESDDSIDVTIVNAGDNVVWNGHEWDVLAGIDHLSSYSTTEEISAMIEAATGEIDTALDGIIAIQNDLIGGDGI